MVDTAMEVKMEGWMEGREGVEHFVESDCERTAAAEDVLCTVINSRPNVIYGSTTAVL